MIARSVPVSLIRGGTSRGVFLRESDLPPDPEDRERTILALFGSPQGKVVDGIGGENPVLRKVAIVGPGETRDDGTPVLDYTFGQVNADMTRVGHANECGNIASGVPLFGAVSGWLRSPSAGTTVVVNLRNTNRRVRAEWLSADDFGGVMRLWLLKPVVSWDDALLLGSPTSVLHGAPWTDVRCTVIRAYNTHLLVDSRDVGLPDPLGPPTVAQEIVAGLVDLVHQVKALLESPAPLKVSLVAPPTAAGGPVPVRTVFPLEGRDHPSVAVTGAAALAAASCIPGSVVHAAAGEDPGTELEIRHPSGQLTLGLRRTPDGRVSEVGIERSCRLIMSGDAYVSGFDVSERMEAV